MTSNPSPYVLQSEMASGKALRIILTRLLTAMEGNLEGARRAADPEFLHDFRVAARRTRSLLNQIKGVLPEETVERFRPHFKWLMKITGPVRDIDVQLLHLSEYQGFLPLALQADLEPLHDFLCHKLRKAQRKLSAHLGGLRTQLLLREWRAALDVSEETAPWPSKAQKKIGGIASRRLWKTCRMVWREGAVLGIFSPPEAFHELRILCKKLRYLMEFFQSLYPAEQIQGLIQTLKKLQDNLGLHQDLTVQIRSLRTFGQEMQRERSDIPPSTYIAMEILSEHLTQGQQALREDFTTLFARFADQENRRLCKALFDGPDQSEDAAPLGMEEE